LTFLWNIHQCKMQIIRIIEVKAQSGITKAQQ